MKQEISRGDVFRVNLDPAVGSEIKKTRPCVVVQNNTGNQYSPVTVVIPITDADHVPKLYPVNVAIIKGEGGLTKNSVVLCNQIRAVDRNRLIELLGRLSPVTMEKVDTALKVELGLK